MDLDWDHLDDIDRKGWRTCKHCDPPCEGCLEGEFFGGALDGAVLILDPETP